MNGARQRDSVDDFGLVPSPVANLGLDKATIRTLVYRTAVP